MATFNVFSKLRSDRSRIMSGPYIQMVRRSSATADYSTPSVIVIVAPKHVPAARAMQIVVVLVIKVSRLTCRKVIVRMSAADPSEGGE